MSGLDLGAVRRDTTAVVHRHFAIFATLVAAFAFLPRLILLIAFPGGGRMPNFVHPAPQPAGYLWATLVATLIGLISAFTIAAIAADPAEGGGRPIGATIVAILPKIGKAFVALLWLAVAYVLGVLAIGIVAIIVSVIVIAANVGGATPMAAATPATTGLIVFGLVALLLPVIFWLYARLTPLLGFLLREPISAFAAIKRAWRLSRGSTWRIVLIWLLFFAALLPIQIAGWMIAGPAVPGIVLEVPGFVALALSTAAIAGLSMYFYAACGIIYRQLADV